MVRGCNLSNFAKYLSGYIKLVGIPFLLNHKQSLKKKGPLEHKQYYYNNLLVNIYGSWLHTGYDVNRVFHLVAKC